MTGCTRRSFVGFCTASAVLAGFGGAVKAADGASDTDILRPPGGQFEPAMLATCLKCDRCLSICHTGVISLAKVDDGFMKARTPTMDFHKGGCDFCGDCQKVCPVGALGAFDPAHNRLGTAIVQKDRCVAYFNGCTECREACPFNAISLDDAGHPVVDSSVCNGCGVCENICPALVYRSFAGGTRRGIVVASPSRFEKLGKTAVEDESEMMA
jgi:ferredoxin-type protein NapG